MDTLFRGQAIRKAIAGFVTAGLTLGITTGAMNDKMQAGDVVGYWKSETGATYRFLHEGDYLIALYEQPNDTQTAAGIKSGDLAYKGTIIDKVASGTFYQYFPIENKKTCPALWAAPTPLCFQVADDFNKMEGDLVYEHISDNGCKIDDRRIARLVLTRFDPTTVVEKKVDSREKSLKVTKPGYTSRH